MQVSKNFILQYSSGAKKCEMDGTTAQALALEIQQLRTSLADAIRRPLGVIPASADGVLSTAELDAAEARRPAHPGR
jgi:hypothetical protein